MSRGVSRIKQLYNRKLM